MPFNELRSILFPFALLVVVFKFEIKLLVNVLKRGKGEENLTELWADDKLVLKAMFKK